jgi:hypothetical protein
MVGAWWLGVARPGRRLVARGSMEDAWLKVTLGEIESVALPRMAWWRGGGSGVVVEGALQGSVMAQSLGLLFSRWKRKKVSWGIKWWGGVVVAD